MAWVTRRQHRFALTGVAALLGTLAVYLWIVGRQLHHAYTAATACHPASSIACGDLISSFNGMDKVLANGFVLQPVPALIGAFVGAPVLARELETGTFRYAWTQGFGRWRWTLAKLVLLAVVVAAAAGALSVLLSWYYQPYLSAGRQTLPLSEVSPFSEASPFRRRTVRPARGRVRSLDAGGVRDRWPGRHAHPPGRTSDCRHLDGLHRARPRGRDVPAPALPDSAGHQQPERARFRVDYEPVVDQGRQVRVRRPAPLILLQQFCPSPAVGARPKSKPSPGTLAQCLSQHNYTRWTSYQPASRFWPFQFIEVGWLLALSVLLIAGDRLGGPPPRGPNSRHPR
jgi:hypothetical protein